MATGITTANSNALLNFLFSAGSYTPPASTWVALFTAAPGYAGGGTEVTGGSYARQEITDADWAAAAGREISNDIALTFPQASASWGLVTHFALFDAPSGGNMLFFGALSQSVSIPLGAQRIFPAGSLTLRLD